MPALSLCACVRGLVGGLRSLAKSVAYSGARVKII